MSATHAPPVAAPPGQTCPRCGCWYNGFHNCGPPQSAPFPRLVTGAEVDALRAEVERLQARVMELERAAPCVDGRQDILPPPYGPPGMVAGP